MRKAHRRIGSWIATFLVLITGGHVQAQSLAQLQFDIVGIKLVIDPPALTVPKDIPTFVNTQLMLPPGVGPEAQAAIQELTQGAAVLAELRGPELVPTTISALPGQPLNLPPLHLPGDYFLDNIRLVKNGTVLLAGTPSIVPIRVISDILISSVTTRELSLEEIQQRGIVIDASSFRALEFQAAFVIDGLPVKITFPVLLPQAQNINVPGRMPQDLATAIQLANEQQQRQQVELPPELDRPGFNLYLVGAEFVPVAPSDATEPTLGIPPVHALVAIIGNIGFLNQIFAATVMVQNGAPDGSNLVVRNVRAEFKLPQGANQVAEAPDAPCNDAQRDDPLRFARTAQVASGQSPDGVQAIVPILHPGLDRQPGTADDRDFLRPQEAGTGEGLLEGCLEGTHVFDVELSAVLEGLPSGAVPLRGLAKGTVLVRNPTFSLTLAHPRTIRNGEPYDLFATVTNTSDRTVNLVSVQLDPRAVSGAMLLSDPTVQFETLAAGEAATARFRLLAQRTGDVTFTQITTAPGITANFTLRTGVDERGVPLSPNALVLPKQVDRLPEHLVTASQRVLGQAFSVATAPQLPPGVRYIPRRIVTLRGQEMADAGMRQVFNEPLLRGISDLLLDWLGNTTPDPGFEQLLRTTAAGSAWADAIGAVLHDQLAAGSVLDLQQTFADTVVYRTPHLSAVVGNGASAAPVRLRITDAFGQKTGAALNDPTAARGIPFSQLFTLAMQDDMQSQMAVVARLNSSVYTVDVFGTGTGVTDLGVVVPLAGGRLLQATYEHLAVVRGTRLSVRVDTQNPGGLMLQVDQDGDGVFETALAPSHTTELVDQAPQVVAARSLTDVTEAFVYNSLWAHMGLLVDVLFNKTVTRESAEVVGNYAIPNNAAQSVILQPTGRVATLLLERPIGALIPRAITVSGIADDKGQVSSPETHDIQDLLSDGAQLVGQVRRADGRPVPQAFVRLSAYVSIPPFPSEITLGLIRTDDNGYFDVDFVRQTLSPYFRVTAIEPLTGEQVSLQSRVRFAGEMAVVNPIFFGRGRVVGTILLPDGVTPAGTTAVNLFPDFYRTGEAGSGVYANAQGVFALDNVPVGNFTLRAERVEFLPDQTGVLRPFATGEFATVTGAVRESGETVEVPIVLTTRPDPGTGGVRGRVFLSDGSTPAARFTVFFGSINTHTEPVVVVPIAQSETDTDGNFAFRDLPLGGRSVIAVDPATRQFATADVVVLPDQLVGVNVIFGSLGSARGIVRDASGNLVRNRGLVAGGFGLVSTGDNGEFFIPEIPIGQQSIAAGNIDTKRTGTATVDIFPGQTTEVEVRLNAVADITGCVTDAQGQRVQGALVRIPQPPAGYFKATSDADGCFIFPNMALGDYTVSATGRNVSAPLSPDEVATRLRDDFSAAAQSGSLAAIRAAFKQAVEVFVGSSNLLFQDPPASTPGNFGYTTVRSFQDGVAAMANIQYIPTGRVAGITIDSNGLPTRAAMQIQGLKLDEFGSPVFGSLGFFDSDTVMGQFDVPAVPFGDYLLRAARPFTPVIIAQRGVLSPANPNDDDLVLQFPPAAETNGTITGTVFLPDGVTPSGENVEVRISFGDLAVRTDTQGKFNSPLPIPAGIYTVTAEDPVTTLQGRELIEVPAGGTIDVPIRLLGRTSVVVMVQRPDGATVPGAQVTVQNFNFTQDQASGVTGTDGKIVVTNLTEGFYSVLAVAGDQLAGRTGFMITQSDALMQRQVGSTVTLRGFGTITGTFLGAATLTPIANAQISLFVEGVSETRAGPAAALTTTDAQGRFIYEMVPVGAFRVHGVDPTSLRVGEASGRLVNQNDTVDITVITGALGRVVGQVLSADGLTPIAGATLRIAPTQLPGAGFNFPLITAGADGTFVYDGIPQGPFTLHAIDRVSGFSGNAAGTVTGEGQTTTVEIRLAGFGTIRGQVFDTDGTVVTNATVTIASVRSNAVTRSTAVDEDGRFEFTFLPLLSYELRAHNTDPLEQLNGGITLAQLTAHGQTLDVRIDLRGVGTVEVTVIESDDTTLVPSADVHLTGRTPFGGDFTVFTEFNGLATIPGVPVGAFNVSVQSSTLRVAGSASGSITSDGETVSVRVKLGQAGTIRGRLALPDANNTPVPGAFVTLDFASQTSFAGTLQVLTNSLGEFAFDNIPVGPFSIHISEPISAGLRLLSDSIAQHEQVVNLGLILLDLEAPRVVTTDPVEGAMGVPISSTIALTFNEPIEPTSVQFDNSGSPIATQGNLLMVDNLQHKLLADVAVSSDGRTVLITPRQALASETRYQVVVRNGTSAIRDAAAGRQVQTPFVLSFTSIDSVPPTLVSATPAAGVTGILPDAVVRLTFSEAMASGFDLTLTRQGQPVAGTVSLLFGGTVAVFTPAQPLATNATYQYTLANATDLAGNALVEGQVTASFATLDTQGPAIAVLTLDGTPSRLAGTSVTVVPGIADADTASVDYAVNDVPVYTVTTAPFALTLSLPTGQAQLHVSATGTDTSGNRGATASFDIPIVPNQPPTVTLTPPMGVTTVVAGQMLSFAVAANDDVALTQVVSSAIFSTLGVASQSRIDPVSGLGSFMAPFNVTIPSAVAANSSVTVQVVARDSLGNVSLPATVTLPVRDGVGPTAAITSPVPNAQVLPGQQVDVVVMACDDVALASVALACGPTLPGCETRLIAPATSCSTQTFTLPIPTTLVAPATVTLVASAVDTSGNASLQVSRVLQLADTVVPTLTSLRTLSGTIRVLPGQSVTVEAQASDNVAVTAFEFRTLGEVVTPLQTVAVAPPAPMAAAQFTFAVPTTATNGSTVTVLARARDIMQSSAEVSLTLQIGDAAPPTVAIMAPAPNTTVLPGQNITLTARATDDVAVSRITLDFSGVLTGSDVRDIVPAVTPAEVSFIVPVPFGALSGSITFNVTARDTAGNDSSVATSTVVVLDNVAPSVQITSPGPGTVVDPRNLSVTVEATDSAGVSEVGFTASGVISAAQTRAITPASTMTTQIFNVSFATLPPSGGALTLHATVRDTAGNQGVAAAVMVQVSDVVPPQVGQVNPPNGATNVDPSTIVSVQFSEAIARSTINATTLSLRRGSTAVPVTLSFSTGDQIITLTPVTQPLPLNTTFTLDIGTGITDVAGHPLAAALSTTFTTASPDVTPPRVANIVPVNGATDISVAAIIQVTFTEPVDPATVTTTSFSVSTGVTPVTGSLSLSNNNATVQFTPAAPLPFATLMTVQLTAAITDTLGNALADANGNALTQPLTFTFTTGAFTITNPVDGSEVVENAPLLLEARGSSALNIATVTFSVNGQALPEVSGPPFNASFTTPAAGTMLTIAATARTSTGTQIAQDQAIVTVVAGLRVQPSLVGVPPGGTTTVHLTLSSPPTTDLEVHLQAVDPSIVTLPVNPVMIVVGQREAVVPVVGATAGSTTLLAQSSRGTGATIVSVSIPVAQQPLTALAPPVGVVALPPPSVGQVIVPENGQSSAPVRLLTSPAPAETPVLVTSSNPAVVQVLGAVTIPQGSQVATLPLTTGSAGEAVLILQAGTNIRQLTVIVGIPPVGRVVPVSAAPVGLVILPPPSVGQVIVPENGQSSIPVRLLTSPALEDIEVFVTSSAPAVVQVLGPVVVPQGAQTALLTLTTGSAGEAVLTLQAGTGIRQLTVIVGVPPAGRVVPVNAAPVGLVILPPPSVGQVIVPENGQSSIPVRLLTSPALANVPVAVSSSNPAVVQVLGLVVVPQGAQIAALTLTTGSPGEAVLTLQAGTDVRQLTVLVGVPPPGRVTPVSAAPVGLVILPAGTAGTLFLDVNGQREVILRLLSAPAVTDLLIQASSTNPQAADITPAHTTLPAGQQDVAFTVHTGTSDAEALIRLNIGTDVRTLLVVVGIPSDERVPLTLAPPVGVCDGQVIGGLCVP